MFYMVDCDVSLYKSPHSPDQAIGLTKSLPPTFLACTQHVLYLISYLNDRKVFSYTSILQLSNYNEKTTFIIDTSLFIIPHFS